MAKLQSRLNLDFHGSSVSPSNPLPLNLSIRFSTLDFTFPCIVSILPATAALAAVASAISAYCVQLLNLTAKFCCFELLHVVQIVGEKAVPVWHHLRGVLHLTVHKLPLALIELSVVLG